MSTYRVLRVACITDECPPGSMRLTEEEGQVCRPFEAFLTPPRTNALGELRNLLKFSREGALDFRAKRV
jgi:hypothetical protein